MKLFKAVVGFSMLVGYFWSNCLVKTAMATQYYIGSHGTDFTDCSGGTQNAPWKTWTKPRQKGCIQPGDTVYFLAGTYHANSGIFEGSGSDRLSFNGTLGKPVRIAPDPQAPGSWPVRFVGHFAIDPAWGEIHGIEFDGVGFEPITINGSYLQLIGNYIHGRPQDFNLAAQTQTGSYDCVKILAGKPDPNRDIQLKNNEIAYCPGDCIDVTGARQLRYQGNNLHHCNTIQVKGGTQDIVIERNRLHDLRQGIRGSSMACSTGYCGSPVIPTLPVTNRFVANNVVIQNNVFYNVAGWDAIGAYGWTNVSIFHNTFYNLNGIALGLGSTGFDFTDAQARTYCQTHTCKPCVYLDSNCWQINYAAKTIAFHNNVVKTVGSAVIYGYRNTFSGFSASHNLYHNSPNSLIFKLVGGGQNDKIYSLSTFPYESNSFESDPGFLNASGLDFRLKDGAFAIDKGISTGVLLDFASHNRDAIPDPGAYEFQKSIILTPRPSPTQSPDLIPVPTLLGSPSPVACPNDYTGDRQRNIQDLLVILNGWGSPYGLPELLSFLASFGLAC